MLLKMWILVFVWFVLVIVLNCFLQLFKKKLFVVFVSGFGKDCGGLRVI